jgi:hypothetical protein
MNTRSVAELVRKMQALGIAKLGGIGAAQQ